MGALMNDTRTFSDLLKMIGANLFRALPFRPDSAADDDEEDEPFMDHNWSHLAIVYELLMRTVQTQKIDTAVKKKCITVNFVRSLLQLFNSEDNRERDYLKTITHRVYGKLTNRRAHIRKCINNVFYEYIYETQQHNGIAELLEILASIINGFAQPVKQEHKSMLVRCLIPLHKLKGVAVYHHQLMYCMTLFAMKDESLPKLVINGLLRFWPCGCSNKELLFLQVRVEQGATAATRWTPPSLLPAHALTPPPLLPPFPPSVSLLPTGA
jgi:serine/threonine-protein phosphatase 2A regulatory subunit B'